MAHKFDPSKAHRLDGDERRKRLDPEAVLASLPIQPDHTVVDVGCGTGFFSLPISRKVPQGRVYALDIADEMIQRTRQKVAENGISNIEVLKTGEMEFPIEAGAADGAFLSFVLHEQEDRLEFMRRIRGFLKTGGWLAVVEWQKKPMDFGPSLEERIDEGELRELADQAGFDTSSFQTLGDYNYLVILRAGDL